MPRNYVSELEAQVKQLTKELKEIENLKEHDSASGRRESMAMSTPTGSSIAESDPRDLVKSMGLVMLESTTQPRFIGTSSGITFAKMVLAAIKCDVSATASGGNDTTFQNTGPRALAVASSLPPRHAAQHITEVYFQYRTPHVPILERKQIEEAMDNAYRSVQGQGTVAGQRNVERDLFTCYMIFAIGLCGFTTAEGVRPSQSEGCFHAAVHYIDKALTYARSDLETVSAVLLLAQYVALCPSMGNLWQLTGIALRLCVDIGLHWETDAVLAMDQNLLDERRRLFWATYSFDRQLAITLGRPFGIADQSINVQYPNPYYSSVADQSSDLDEIGINHKRVANHLVSLYRLESEVKHVLYHQLQGTTLAYPRANYALWIRDIQPRLREWHDAIPPLNKTHPQSLFACQSWWDATWCNTLLLLHRPNPLVTHPTTESFRVCYDTSCKAIESIKALQREQKICVTWRWVHHLFLAGITLMYTLWHSHEVRVKTSVMDVMHAVQSCNITLTALAERFGGAVGCRDAFEKLSTATLRWLLEKGSESAQQEQSTFDHHLASIQEELRIEARTLTGWDMDTDDQLGLLPTDGFDYAEFLSAAAQWPVSMSNEDFPEGLDNMFNFGTEFT